MSNLLKHFVADEQGATAIEYGLIAAGISVAIIAVVQKSRLVTQYDLHERCYGFEIVLRATV